MDATTIPLADVLERMDKGEMFALTYVKADRRRGTGGQMVTEPKVMKEGVAVKKSPAPANDKKELPSAPKNPNHYENSTRNLRIMGTQKTIKVHIRLMIRFNGLVIL